jgi:hypothetical protein
MWASLIIGGLTIILSLPMVPVVVSTTFVGGVVMAIPVVGLVFISVASLGWAILLGPLLALGWVWHQDVPLSQPLLAALGIPLAVVGFFTRRSSPPVPTLRTAEGSR